MQRLTSEEEAFSVLKEILRVRVADVCRNKQLHGVGLAATPVRISAKTTRNAAHDITRHRTLTKVYVINFKRKKKSTRAREQSSCF